VRVTSDGPAAIQTTGPGEVCIEDVAVEATRGVGVLAEGTTRLTVRRTRLLGPVTPDNAASRPSSEDPTEAATHGIMAHCATLVVLEDVEVWGWDESGVRVMESRLEQRGGRVGGGLGTGIFLAASEGEIIDVEIAEMLQGTRIISSYGLLAGVSELTARGLVIRDNEGYGALFSGGRALLADTRVVSNDQGGLWGQNGALAIEGSVFEDNGSAAVALAGATEVRIEDSSLSSTRAMPRIVAPLVVSIGSGLMTFQDHAGPLTLRRVRFEDNALTGAFIRLSVGYDEALILEDVTVTPASTGFFLTGGPAPSGWESGVEPPEATGVTPDPTLEELGGAPSMGLPPADPDCP
jgi:hypothetical protein